MTASAPSARTPGTLRTAQKTATRERLVTAALHILSEKGYAQMRIDDVAAAAGASRGTFYLHFRSKAELLEELTGRAADIFDPTYEKLQAALVAADTREISAWISRTLDLWADAAPFMRPVYEAAEGDPELARRLLPDVVPGSGDLARTLLAAGVCTDEHSAAATAIVFLAPLSVAFRQRAYGSPVDEELLASIIEATWVAYINSTRTT